MTSAFVSVFSTEPQRILDIVYGLCFDKALWPKVTAMKPQTRMELLIASDIIIKTYMLHGVDIERATHRIFAQYGRAAVADGCYNIFTIKHPSGKGMFPSRYALVVAPFCTAEPDVQLMLARGVPVAMVGCLWSIVRDDQQKLRECDAVAELVIILEWSVLPISSVQQSANSRSSSSL